METTPPPVPSVTASPCRPPRSRWAWILGSLFFSALAVGLALVVFFIISFTTALKDGMKLTNHPLHLSEATLVEGGDSKIAQIDLAGVISGTSEHNNGSMVDDFEEQLNTAKNDDQIKAIVIRINSPGGEVTASDYLHHIIQETDKVKPVIAYLDTIAASGGYYAACGTRHLMAHPTTFTGSIGVIMQSVKYADLLDKLGLRMEVYKSGTMKDLLSGSRRTYPEEAALVSELIAETYERFLGVVAENRHKPIEELRGSKFTDGRIFSGKQALAAGFVDSNGFIADAYAKAAEIAGIEDPTIIRYEGKQDLLSILEPFLSSKAGANKVELDVSTRLLPKIQSGVPLYLHTGAY